MISLYHYYLSIIPNFKFEEAYPDFVRFMENNGKNLKEIYIYEVDRCY